ncbi:hypothetical protein BGZ52_002775 [Haplosporangium bisporale]|nr:hypothetical protein BGZ52_002775 [Haplosporangium bisporale]
MSAASYARPWTLPPAQTLSTDRPRIPFEKPLPPPPALSKFYEDLDDLIKTFHHDLCRIFPHVSPAAFDTHAAMLKGRMRQIYEDHDYPSKQEYKRQDSDYILSAEYRAERNAKNLEEMKRLFFARIEEEEEEEEKAKKVQLEIGESSKMAGGEIFESGQEPSKAS